MRERERERERERSRKRKIKRESHMGDPSVLDLSLCTMDCLHDVMMVIISGDTRAG